MNPPPPYSPQYAPTAPSVDQVASGHEFGVQPYQSNHSVAVHQLQLNTNTFVPSASGQVFSPVQHSPIIPSLTPTVAQNAPAVQRIIPLRCMAGTVEIANGTTLNIEKLGPWKTQYIEVRDSLLYMSPSAPKRSNASTKQLLGNFISLPDKRIVAIEDDQSYLVIRAPSEMRAHQWFTALSQYCFAAPTMSGYCQKLSNRKKVYENRFLRLSSSGILSWFRTDSEDSDRRGSIQVRGQLCEIDQLNVLQVNIQISSRTYQFCFSNAREAQLWLAALQWHYGRKPLVKATVSLRNKAK